MAMGSPRIVVIGGGFAGTTAARHLLRRHRDMSVLLVSQENYFVYQPLLPEVVGGAIHALDTVAPLREMLPGAELRAASVRTVDLTQRWIEVVEGSAGRVERLAYDHLVLAMGLVADLSRYPGLEEHGFTVKDAAEAYALRNHVIGCLEQAAIMGDESHRKRLLTFVVVGGGYSGIEVLGEMHELVRRALPFYPTLHATAPRFVLVEYQNAILPEVPQDLAHYAHRVLHGRGIEFMLGHGVKAAAATALELDDGTIIDTMTVVATIGNGPTPLARELGLKMEHGRIVTEPDMRVPDFDNVWAIGDAASTPLARSDRPAPPTAQAAVREGEILAANILAAMDGRPTQPLTFKSRGAFASLGGRRAVALVFGLRLSGLSAWLLWLVAYAAMLPTWSTRIRVTLERLLDLALPRSVTRTRMGGVAPSRYVRHRAGDVVLSPGQLGDGVHLVIEGSYEQAAPEGAGKVFLPGDSFGQAEIAAGMPHKRFVRAREPSRCFILGREEYLNIQEALRQARERLPAGQGAAGSAAIPSEG
ncbi:MAG: FAD-dependent oxidoreductase [Magnetospirillum sp.]|nr:FAD-dependent oxidoreductase [Magnetospirillum sp.]